MQPDLEWALIKARKFGKSLQRILLKLMNHNETLFLGLLGIFDICPWVPRGKCYDLGPLQHKLLTLPTLLTTNYGADNWSWKGMKQNYRTTKSWHLLSIVLLGPLPSYGRRN